MLLASASSNGLRFDFVGPKVVLVNTLKEGMPRQASIKISPVNLLTTHKRGMCTYRKNAN